MHQYVVHSDVVKPSEYSDHRHENIQIKDHGCDRLFVCLLKYLFFSVHSNSSIAISLNWILFVSGI